MKKLSMILAAAAFAGALTANAQTSLGEKNFYVTTYDTDLGDYVDIAQPFTSEVSIERDGSFVIADYAYSGKSLSFTLGDYYDNASGTAQLSDLTFTGEHVYPSASGNSVRFRFVKSGSSFQPIEFYDLETDEATSIAKPYLYQCTTDYSTYYSYGLKYEDEDGKEVEYVTLCTWGTPSGGVRDGLSTYYYVYFYLSDEPVDSAVRDLSIDDATAAPVEYFNLHGQRVANPDNGLYIRRQGNNVKKVIL